MIYPIMLLLIIIIIKSIFSAAETAFVYINRAEIKQLSKTDKKAEKIRILMEDSNKFFGVIEVGIITCELFASAIVSITYMEYFMAYLERNNFSAEASAVISVIVITIILAYIMLLFGSLIPKRIARNHPKKTAYGLISILWIVTKLNYPFERLIDGSTNIFSKILKIKEEFEEKMTEKQLKMIISEAKDEGVLQSVEKKIFMNTLKANDKSVYKIMLPLEDVHMIDINSDFSKMLEVIKKDKFTRIPVYEGTKENIIGIFYIKDIVIQYTETGIQDKEQIKDLLRKPNYIYKEEKLFSAFKKIQEDSSMLGIVTDEKSKPIGIVTVEDILEKLVGKIIDEDDEK